MSEQRYTVRTGWWREMRRGGQQVSIEETDILCGHERIACGITREWSEQIAAALNAAEESNRREGLLERIVGEMQDKVRYAEASGELCPSCGADLKANLSHWSHCFYNNTLAEYQLTKGESDGLHAGD